MPQNTSTRFRLFAATFMLAALALASCNAQSPPVALAGGTDQATVSQPATAARIQDETPIETKAEAAAAAIAPADRAADDRAVKRAADKGAVAAETKREETVETGAPLP
jgi:hypothetical protein